MFRKMRRHKQLLPENETLEMLQKATSGVLALSGDEGYPYAVPLSFAYDGGKLYFHCAPEGHKLDAISRSDKASFCILYEDRVLPEKFTTCYRSVIAFGRICRVTDAEEKRLALKLLAKKYSPDAPDSGEKEIESAFDRVCVLRMTIEHATGKEAIELMKS